MRLLAIPLLVVLVVLVSLPGRSDACTCTRPSLATAVRRGEAVFVGRITGVTRRPVDPARCARQPADWCVHAYTYDVTVEGVWKGQVAAKVRVYGGSGRGDCSYGRLRGARRWLFVTSRRGSRWRGPAGAHAIHTCGGTRPATAATLAAMRRRHGAPRTP